MTFNLYTFGCSFTEYVWTTWADILGHYAEDYTNFGKAGSGSYYSFNQLIHFITNKKFTEKDFVAICWTTPCREDRIKNSEWLCSGALVNTRIKEFQGNFIEELFDTGHYLELQRIFVLSAIELLESKNINYVMFSLDGVLLNFNNKKNIVQHIININIGAKLDVFKNRKLKLEKVDVYSEYQKKLLPSMKGYLDLRNNTVRPIFESREGKLVPDYHPTPAQHLKYLENIILPALPFDVKIDNQHRISIEKETEQILRQINKLPKKYYDN